MRISLQLDMEELKLNPQYISKTKGSRLYDIDCPIIGLTGSIATGKSTVSKLFSQDGYPVIDADQLIRNIYSQEDTISFIQSLKAQVVENNIINFKLLRSLFFNNKDLKEKIEMYLYAKLPSAFLNEINNLNQPNFIIYDVPLLFEKELEKMLDLTITVYCPSSKQLDRLMKRDNIDEKLANTIINHQLSIEIKAKKADFILDNSKDLNHLFTEYQQLKEKLFNN